MLVSKARLGMAIAQAREKAGLSQVELAQTVGLDEAKIKEFEEGKERPESANLSDIATALGVTELELLSRPVPRPYLKGVPKGE
jgi:ribosome-binding protein aMBF1 (putative translation factor)